MAASAALIAPASGVAPEPVATYRFNTEKTLTIIAAGPTSGLLKTSRVSRRGWET